MHRFFIAFFLLALAAFAQQTPALVDATTGALKRPVPATFRSANGLAIGTDIQAYNANLAAISGLTSAADKLPYFTGSGTAALADFTTGGRALVNSAGTADTFPYFSASNTVTLGSITTAGRNLIDDASASAQRTTLGVGTGDSPTFAAATLSGNLTFGTSASVLNGTTGSIGLTATGTNQSIALTPSGTGRVTAIHAGSQQGLVVRTGNTGWSEIGAWSGASDEVQAQVQANGSGARVLLGSRSNHPVVFNVADTEAARIATTSRNLLIGTTTDSSNGKLQLATHTASTGGIGFGTDAVLYRRSVNVLGVGEAAATKTDLFVDSNTVGIQVRDSGFTGVGGWMRYTSSANANKWSLGMHNTGSGAEESTLKFAYNNGSAWGNALVITGDTTGGVNVPATTASTSTTTGALTVAGGIGVAGAINAGGNVQLFAPDATVARTAIKLFNGQGSAGGSNAIRSWSRGTNTETNLSSAIVFGSGTGPSSIIQLNVADQGISSGTEFNALLVAPTYVSIPLTTASGSTSSGALIVSGGVGVGGAGYFGGAVTVNSANGVIINSVSGVDRNFYIYSSGSARWLFGADSTAESGSNAGSDFRLRGYTDGATLSSVAQMRMKRDTGDTSFSSTTEATTAGAGSLTTAGGIYAAKKVVAMGGLVVDKTVTAGGTTGAQTINKPAGTVNFAAAATSLVVTNSLVTSSSIIICTVGTNDATMHSVQAVAGTGSFTLYPNAAPTGETRVNFHIVN